MSKLVKRVSCAALAGTLAAGVITGCGAKAEGIDGTKTAVTVNDEKITLGEVSFYAHFNGANLYTYYYNYFGTTNLFDTVMDEETGQTYGEYMVTTAAEELTDMALLKQHAEEYGVVIDDEAKAAIEAAAQAYIDENDEEVLAKIGASKEDVAALMELQTYQSLMYDALGETVDTEVSDEESQQTSVNYISFALVTDEETEEQGIVAEEETEDDMEVEADTPTVEEQNAVKWADAEALLAALKARSDNVTTDEFNEVAKELKDTYSVTTETFTKANPTDTTLDGAVVEAAKGLDDGAIIPQVIENEDATYLYVAAVNKVVDEDATSEKKEEIIKERKQENYDTLLAGWKESAEITTDEKALALIVITDAAPITFKTEETAEAENAEATDATESETAESDEAESETAESETAETETAETAAAETAEAAATAETAAAAATAETAEAAAAAETAEAAATAETAEAAATAETAEAAAAAETAEAAAAAETAEAAATAETAAAAATAETAAVAATAETAEAAATTETAAAAETTEAAATTETAETAATAG